jgi:hypothetical protein
MSSICSTRYSTSAVHRSVRASAAGDALAVGELDDATGASEDVHAALARMSETIVTIGRRRLSVRIVRNRTRYYGFVASMLR